MMKLEIQKFGGRGASSSASKKEYIVVSQNNGKSKIVERNSGRTIAENLSLAEANKNSQLLSTGQANLKDFGYQEQKTNSNNNSSSILKSSVERRKAQIEYAVQRGNYNYLPDDITDKELERVRKRINAKKR